MGLLRRESCRSQLLKVYHALGWHSTGVAPIKRPPVRAHPPTAAPTPTSHHAHRRAPRTHPHLHPSQDGLTCREPAHAPGARPGHPTPAPPRLSPCPPGAPRSGPRAVRQGPHAAPSTRDRGNEHSRLTLCSWGTPPRVGCGGGRTSSARPARVRPGPPTFALDLARPAPCRALWARPVPLPPRAAPLPPPLRTAPRSPQPQRRSWKPDPLPRRSAQATEGGVAGEAEGGAATVRKPEGISDSLHARQGV